MDDRSSQRLPIWIWGALLGVLLIGLSVSSRGRLSPGNDALSQYFAAQPTPAGLNPSLELPQLDFGALPPALQDAARELWQRLGQNGTGSPLEPNVTTPRLRIEVRQLQQSEAGLQVTGQITNISQSDVVVPISAFELRDSAGASYVAGGGASATLKPGEATPLELTVPLPQGRGLLLITRLPPDPPVEQRLIVAEP